MQTKLLKKLSRYHVWNLSLQERIEPYDESHHLMVVLVNWFIKDLQELRDGEED
jgi:hypothetical protein